MSESATGDDAAKSEDAAAQPQPCDACRATGKVFAARGGEQVSVDCPWCRGTAVWEPGYDAQAAGVFPGA